MDDELKKKFEDSFGVKLKENPDFDDKEFKLKQLLEIVYFIFHKQFILTAR